jgi:hypothetical protein
MIQSPYAQFIEFSIGQMETNAMKVQERAGGSLFRPRFNSVVVNELQNRIGKTPMIKNLPPSNVPTPIPRCERSIQNMNFGDPFDRWAQFGLSISPPARIAALGSS